MSETPAGPKSDSTKETLLQNYIRQKAAYDDAVLNYNAKRLEAATASGQEGKAAVADWAINAQIYYLRVKVAADEARQAQQAAGLTDEGLNEIASQLRR